MWMDHMFKLDRRRQKLERIVSNRLERKKKESMFTVLKNGTPKKLIEMPRQPPGCNDSRIFKFIYLDRKSFKFHKILRSINR